MIVTNVKRLQTRLKGLSAKTRAGITGSVIVGYTANYAVYVHENKEARHAEGKQDKFLEDPARKLSNSGELAGIISTAVKAGAPVMMGLKLAGLRIQRESQRVVPVDTGNLKGSAFTRVEK